MHNHGSYSTTSNQDDGDTSKQIWINTIIITMSVIIIFMLIILSFNKGLLVKLLEIRGTEIEENSDGYSNSYSVGKVVEIEYENENLIDDNEEDIQYNGYVADVLVVIQTGKESGDELWIKVGDSDRNLVNMEGELIFGVDSEVIVLQADSNGISQSIIVDIFRLPAVIVALVMFLVLAIVFAGIKGLSSFLGLVISMIILVGFIVPGILTGGNPVLVSFLGAVAIAFFSLYLAHGFNKRTSIALISTLICISMSVVLAIVFVELTKLIGVGNDESLHVESITVGGISLKGLLLGGIIIGTLGVLDDITTAQTAVVEEIKNANKKLKFQEVYSRANSVGKEHIASLINTLVLAYAGSSFALFILIVANTTDPLWVTLNSAFLVEEIVRTIVGSSVLVLAVPISTVLAAYIFTKEN